VNISEESTKSGVTLDELPQLIDCIAQCQHLTLRGIMAIPEKNADKSSYKKMFQLYSELKNKQRTQQKHYKNFNIDTLSMGMSNDLSAAIAGGSTMVRIGSAIFGQRSYTAKATDITDITKTTDTNKN
jgi:pyridoxal phosphate enzyme (YggS family)